MQVLKLAKEDAELVTRSREVMQYKRAVMDKTSKGQRITAKERKEANTPMQWPALERVKKIVKKQKKKVEKKQKKKVGKKQKKKKI